MEKEELHIISCRDGKGGFEYGIFQQRSRCNADSWIHVLRKPQRSDADHYRPHYLYNHAAHLEFYGIMIVIEVFPVLIIAGAVVIEDELQMASESFGGFMRTWAVLNFNCHMNKSLVLGNVFISNKENVP